MKYIALITSKVEETKIVEAASPEEARTLFGQGNGEVSETKDTEIIEIGDIVEI